MPNFIMLSRNITGHHPFEYPLSSRDGSSYADFISRLFSSANCIVTYDDVFQKVLEVMTFSRV